MKCQAVKRHGYWYKVFGALLSFTLASGCNHVPSQDILGSFFPAWMLCALVGILLTVVVRQIVIRTGVDAFVHMRLILYLGLAMSLTFFMWVAWYGN
jgi:hypothetical protein